MSNELKRFKSNAQNWWEKLGLTYAGMLLVQTDEFELRQTVSRFLAEHPPTTFKGENPGDTLTLEELTERVRNLVANTELNAQSRRKNQEQDRRKYGWKMLKPALAAPDAGIFIEDGPWAGFTKGEARAWLWNLHQYEPRGITTPGSMLRHKSLQELESGGIPTYFGYPERARELADQGLTPQKYREYKEALNTKTFTPQDVKFGR